MKIYRARAFTYSEKIEGKKVIGNPASIIICEKNFPLQEKMQNIAIKENQPISIFLKEKNSKKKEFNIRYFFPNGKELSICGHGSLASAGVINKLFNYNNIRLVPNEKLLKKNIDITIQGDIINMILPTYIPQILDNENLKKENFNLLLSSLNLSCNDIKSFFLFEETIEYILEIEVFKLRNLKINFKKLSDICTKLNCLSIFITSKSNLKDFDYEARVFAPHCNLNEDIVCGSANSVLAPFWSEKLNKKDLKVLFPYEYKNGKIGGIININYNKKDSFIILSGKIDYEEK